MFDVLLILLLVGFLVMAGIGICQAISKVAAHVQGHPEAGKALFEHLFVPLFGTKKEPTDKDSPANPA